jgi:hypothetical protein
MTSKKSNGNDSSKDNGTQPQQRQWLVENS